MFVREKALADERVRHFTGGKPLRKAIYVPKRLLNLVIWTIYYWGRTQKE
ncbi:MAG: hypothetical protein NT106_09460 [Candidatus Sumerlaeota bacterium]|nr:hypothetical protein [Candidatus Sumerlaeota bacterium]